MWLFLIFAHMLLLVGYLFATMGRSVFNPQGLFAMSCYWVLDMPFLRDGERTNFLCVHCLRLLLSRLNYGGRPPPGTALQPLQPFAGCHCIIRRLPVRKYILSLIQTACLASEPIS